MALTPEELEARLKEQDKALVELRATLSALEADKRNAELVEKVKARIAALEKDQTDMKAALAGHQAPGHTCFWCE